MLRRYAFLLVEALQLCEASVFERGDACERPSAIDFDLDLRTYS